MAKKPPHPFVKWLGGKTKILPQVTLRLPSKIKTYYEPMTGGGAVFIELAKQKKIERAVLNDMCPDLMAAWRSIKSNVNRLIKELKSGRYIYDRDIYLRIREEDPNEMDDIKRAARFIYLNRTCFNAVYRVNKKAGKFNVPFGKYKDPLICDEPNLRAVSELLKIAILLEVDFEQALEEALAQGTRGDAVYFDPPYIPISATANFTAYTGGGFSFEDHQRIVKLMRKLGKRKVRAVVSNSSADVSVELFSVFDMDLLTGTRSCGGAADSRKSVKEIIAFTGPRS
ncbi:MAG: Dam family site-specific DNA-(adenine-N6)-methyltransferase [Lentisphaeria bacterium]|jgi:DNA adenine methylase